VPPSNPAPSPGAGLGAIIIGIIIVAILALLAYLIYKIVKKLRRKNRCKPKLVGGGYSTHSIVQLTQDQNGDCRISLGPDGTDGAVMDVSVLLPHDDCSGQLKFVQNVHFDYERNNAIGGNSPHECISTHGQWVLDGADPYNLTPPVHVKGKGPHHMRATDRPTMKLEAEISKMNLKFRMYLMWMPDGGTAWSTVARLDWFMQGSATTTGKADQQCWNGQNYYKLISGGSGGGMFRPASDSPVLTPDSGSIISQGWQKC
jgi:hypothetical protein